MKVLLLQKVPKLGQKGEIKEVSDGYAANYLLPNKLATAAATRTVADWRAKEERLKREAERELMAAQKLASSLDGLELEISAKVSKDGVLFGGIAAAQIMEALNKKGFKIAKEQIAVGKPIKSIGEHQVMIRLGHGLEAEITVIILAV